MPIDLDAVVAAARSHLLAPGAVTDGWSGRSVERDGEEMVVRFRWRRLPYRLQVRFGPDDLTEGPWTGLPVATPQEWVHDAAGLLMEELDTGGIAWLPRRLRGEELELLLDEPRHGDPSPARRSAYYVSTWSLDAVDVAAQEGLDPAPAVDAAAAGRLLAWWCAYVDNAFGRPYVAQLVVTRDGDGARLEHLQVRRDLPGPVPDGVVAEMAYLAVLGAACEGFPRVVCDLGHPALRHVGGLLPAGGQALQWTADGPAPSPPDLGPATVPRDWDSEEDIGLAQGELSDDLERLLAYAERHPEEYGGVQFVGARLAISFTTPDRHRAAVRAAVEHPDRVDVVHARRTQRDLQRVREAVEAVLEQDEAGWSSLGRAGEHLVLRLRPRGLATAERVWQAHGDAVSITVGGHPYPLDEQAVAAQQRPLGPRQTEPWPAGLVAGVRLDRPTTPVGSPVLGQLVLRATTAPVAFDSDQPLHGELLDDAGRRVNSLDGFWTGTGWDWRLQPGEERSVAFTAGTDSARLADGPLVAAGRWRLVVPVPVHRQTSSGLVTTQLVAGPFEVQLTDHG